ncbi:MAG: hypothetical protein QGF90_06260 [Gammaproteobacteria bacterium]|jgi:translation initiation factor eIF-2B subunit delta|nr:hypothetical protein [Gammaproteobacteria bacterium]|tara:strand:- start:523 stop:1353 length:831 start_codon:yes stop_codon:yes gene_type:complete
MLSKDLLNIVKSDRDHDSTELTLLAIDGVRRVVEQNENENLSELVQGVKSLIVDLRNSRPSMVALDNLLEPIQNSTLNSGATNVEMFRTKMVNSCADVIRFARNAQDLAVQNMVSLIEANDVIMTHSISSTVKNVFAHLSESQPTVEIIITESRPGDEGKLLTAFLSELGLNTTCITEAQIDLLMPKVNKVVVGADAVLADGSIINKRGTNVMALSARYHSVPFYVCAESFKLKTSNDYELEQMSDNELRLDVPGIETSNIYFERLPLELITQWVC